MTANEARAGGLCFSVSISTVATSSAVGLNSYNRLIKNLIPMYWRRLTMNNSRITSVLLLTVILVGNSRELKSSNVISSYVRYEQDLV
jgi:hypothetical protein